jgi:hypothetical protein
MYFTPLEVGIAGGCSQYFGDLNEHYGIKTINGAGGFYLRRRINAYIAVKLLANYTKVSYDDKYNKASYPLLRNLNFQSNITEIALQAEFNFFSFVTGDPYRRFTPFLTGGVGMFFYDPYTEYNGKKVYLRPLGTEGQFAGHADRKYGTTSVCFPVGAGVKYWLTPGVNLTLEIADRLTLTDYLDDVSTTYVGAGAFSKNPTAAALQDRSVEGGGAQSIGTVGKQRGNTSSKDQYMMALFSVSFTFKSYRCPKSGNDDDLRVR